MLQKTNQRLRTISIVVLVAVIAACGLMIWAGQRLTTISGAHNLALDEQSRVWLDLDGQLFRLSPAGVIETHLDPQALGLGMEIQAIVPLANGNVWIGSRQTGKLHLFTANGQRIAETSLPASTGPIFGTFHAAYEPKTDRLIVADTQNHRLLSFNGKGELIAENLSTLPLKFPNSLATESNGTVLLANTNEHSVQRIHPDLTRTPDMLSVKIVGVLNEWPVFVSSASDGRFYASWHGNMLLKGIVNAYDHNGRVLYKLPLEESAEPQSVLARSDDVLVALKSGDDFSIRRFDLNGNDLGVFGNAQLKKLLTEDSTQHKRLAWIKENFSTAVYVGGLILLLLALRMRQRVDIQASEAIAMPQRTFSMKKLIWVFFLVIGGMLVVVVGLPLGMSFALKAAVAAHRSGSHALVVLYLILPAFVYFIFVLAWRATPSFLAFHTWLLRRRIQAWSSYLPELLYTDERVEDYGLITGLLRSYVLVATNRRLLVLLAAPGSSRQTQWQANWTDLLPLGIPPRPWWLWLINPISLPVQFMARNGQQSFAGYCVNRYHLNQLKEFFENAANRAKERLEKNEAPSVSRTFSATPKLPPVIRSAVLSVLLPGLGHLDQGRTRHGLSLMLIALVLLNGSWLTWANALQRFSEQPAQLPWVLALMYLPVLIFAVWDVVRYARPIRKLTN